MNKTLLFLALLTTVVCEGWAQHKEASILILSNRIALNMQLKSEYVKVIDQYSGSRCKKYAKQFDESTDKQKNNFYDFGAVKILSYHQLWANRHILKEKFSFVIMDECHFFVQDTPFNFCTDLMVSVKQSGGFYSILPCEIMLPIKATKFFQLSQFTKCA